MYSLHAQDLIIALFIVEHGCGKVVEDILRCQWSIGLYPFVPDEESVTIVVRWMKVVDIHNQGQKTQYIDRLLTVSREAGTETTVAFHINLSSCYTVLAPMSLHKNVHGGPINFQRHWLCTICSCLQPQQVPILILRLASRPHNPRCFRMDPHCPFSAAHSSAPILLCGLSSTTGVHTSWKHFTNLLLSFPMVAATPSNKVLESTTICVAGLAQVVTPQSSAKPSSSRLFLYPLCVSSEVANVSKVLAELLTSASYQLRRMY